MKTSSRAVLIAYLLIITLGCEVVTKVSGRSFHDKVGWKADDYFSDPRVVELCDAIETSNLKQMASLIHEGADVNAIGKDGMTPLLWAFPENNFERFELLLKHRADPTVHVQSDLGTRGFIHRNQTVAHLAAESQFPEHFIAIMKYGCDPNLVYEFDSGPLKYEKTLFHSIFDSFYLDKRSRCDAILMAGPSKETLTSGARTIVDCSTEFGMALSLLKAGGDFRSYDRNRGKFVNYLADAERKSINGFPKARSEFLELVEWLKSQGENFDEARKDLERWLEAGKINPSKMAALRKSDIEKKIRMER